MLNQAYSAELANLPQPHLAELAGRIDALRERIAEMAVDGKETRRQSELLFDMLKIMEVFKAAKHLQPLAWIPSPASIQPPTPFNRYKADAPMTVMPAKR